MPAQHTKGRKTDYLGSLLKWIFWGFWGGLAPGHLKGTQIGTLGGTF